MGIVYRATQLSTNRPVAIKVLLRPLEVEQVERFRREAQLVSRLEHAAIVRLIDYSQTNDVNGCPYLVTEFLTGSPLATLIEPGGLPTARVLYYLAEIADALTEPHHLGIAHRDIKPDNIFVQRIADREQLKLIDFGIAKPVTTEVVPLTADRHIVGTPPYMSPEQCAGDVVGPQTDVYALGIVAFELLTGKLPFGGPSVAAVLASHVLNPVPSIRAMRNPSLDLPPQLEALVLRMLEKTAAARPADATVVHEALDAISRELRGISRADGVGTIRASASIDSARTRGISGTFVRDVVPDTTKPLPGREPAMLRAPVGGPTRRSPWIPLALLAMTAAIAGVTISLWPDSPEVVARPIDTQTAPVAITPASADAGPNLAQHPDASMKPSHLPRRSPSPTIDCVDDPESGRICPH